MAKRSLELDKKVIRGAGGGGKGGGSQRTPVESPNTLQSRSTARIIDLISEGEIAGLVNGAQSIYFDDTPLQNSDGTYNFQHVSWDYRLGTPSQEYMSGFPSIETEIEVGVRVLQATPVVRSVTDTNMDAVRVTLRIPALNQLINSGDEAGDLRGTTVQIAVDIKTSGAPDGTYQEVVNRVIDGKCTTAYEEAYRISLRTLPSGMPAPAGPWDIRFRRVSADSESAAIQNETFWRSYTEIIDNKVSYMDSAIVGISVDAQTFGGRVPVRSYDIKGVKIRVPSNYDPMTRTYTGIWDGTFQVAWSDNPAWVFYDLLTNTRYGLGEYIDADAVDKWSLYEIARYCDDPVEDGFGSLEPRFTFNGVLATRQDAIETLQAIASAFRGMVYWSSGTVTATQDAPKDVAVLATPANVINGQFTYRGTPLSQRHTVALVTWNDPDDNYKPAVEVVENQDGLNRYGYRPVDVMAVGCTSRGQAHRFGKWMLDSELNETEMVSYTAGMDHGAVRPGEIVAVADPAVAGVRFGGRIASGSTTSILNLDAPVDLDVAEGYTVSVVLPDGTVADRAIAVQFPGGETTQLILPNALPQVPVTGAVFVITGTDAAPRLFRVLTVRELEGGAQYGITALLYDQNKFARVEQGIVLEELAFSRLSKGPLAPPTGLTWEENLYRSNNAVKTRVTLSWVHSTDTRRSHYEIAAKRPDGNWSVVGMTSTNSFDVPDVEPGIWEFSVKTVSLIGYSMPLLLEDVEILGKMAPPDDVEGLVAEPTVNGVSLYWDEVTDIDLIGYEVRMGSDWDSAEVLSAAMKGTSLFVTLDDVQEHTFLVRSLDDSGNYSTGIASVTASVVAPDDVTVFDGTPQGDHIQFTWRTVPGIDVEYEIRRGAGWDLGTFVARSAGDNVSVLYPFEGLGTFWIKSLSKLGLYSENPKFVTFLGAVTEGRNIIWTQDEAAGGFTGVKHGMQVNVDDELEVIQVSGLSENVGEYFYKLDLGETFRARNWVDHLFVVIADDTLTWENADFEWNSITARDTSWFGSQEVGAGTSAELEIMVEEALPDTSVEGFTLDETLVGINGTTPSTSAGITYAPAWVSMGLLTGPAVVAQWPVAFPSEFTQMFRFIISDTIGEDCVFLTIKGPSGRRLELHYIAADEKFVLRDQNGDEVEVVFPLTTGDYLHVGIAQTATHRRLLVHSHLNETHEYVEAAIAALGTFDTLAACAA